MQLLAFAASTRKGSLNRKLTEQAAALASAAGAQVALADYAAFDSPSYHDADYQTSGLPAGSARFRDALLASAGMMIAVPEYNWSYPGSLKTIIDWMSRLTPVPLTGKTALLLSATPSLHGGVKGLLHFRQVLEALGVFTYPKVITVSDALNAFDANGELTVPVVQKELRRVVPAFVEFTRRLAS